MTEERKPLSIFVKQKSPDGTTSMPNAPTSADVKKKLMEVLDNMGDSAAIAAIAKATAGGQDPEAAAGMPKPWEGITETAKAFGINLSELWQAREGELKAAREAATNSEKELHELRMGEIDHRVKELQDVAEKTAAKVNLNQPQGGEKSFLEKLDEMTGGLVAKRIGTNLFPDNPQTAPPAQPVDPVEEFLRRLDQTDQLKQRLGVAGGAQQLAQQGGVRGEVIKLLLEDERDRLKINYEHEAQTEKNKHLGVLAGAVKDNMEDIIGASRDMVAEHREAGKGSGNNTPDTETEGFAVKCNECGEVSILQDKPTGNFECPKCHAQLQIEQPGGKKPFPPRGGPQTSPNSSLEF